MTAPGHATTTQRDGAVLTRPPSPGLDQLLAGIRSAVGRHDDWQRTAGRVAAAMRGRLPTPAELLTAEQLAGSPDRPRSHLLHVEPDGTFSVVALVWRPGQATPIHDHVTWCVFGVVQGVEYEELYTLDERQQCLRPAGTRTNGVGDISGFAPPGDLHLVRNTGDRVAVSVHVYGTDLSRVGSSVRRYYDLPVLTG
jgi:predicted metal-dependent enzyme (double-stranded beta helix superfamily)